MTDRTQRARRVGAFALALAITLSAMGAAAAVISARTPDASDIPRIATTRPLVTPLVAPPATEESTATPTGTVEASAPVAPAPADRYVPPVASGDQGRKAPLGSPDGDKEDDGDDGDEDGHAESDEDDEREVITPPVREEDDSEDDSDHDGSETDVKRESLPDTDESPEED